MTYVPSITDYRVDFVVRGVDKEACIKRFITQREKKDGPIIIEFDRNFKFVIGLDGIESFARYLFGPYAYESDLSGPLETYQRAKEFAELAGKGGATGIRIVPRFKVRKEPASDKFVKAKDVPEFIRVTACMEPA